MALSPEEILLRWFNYHLEEAGSSRRVNNFTKDIMVINNNCTNVIDRPPLSYEGKTIN